MDEVYSPLIKPRLMTPQESRMWRDENFRLFREKHPGPVRLRFNLNIGMHDAIALGFDRYSSPPKEGEVRDVEPAAAFAILTKGWAVEVAEDLA